MTSNEHDLLAVLCAELQAGFPGTVVAFEGFLTPYLGGDRSGVSVVEAFGVSPEDESAFLRRAEALADECCDGGGPLVVFSLWTPQETREHFEADLRAIRAAREARYSAGDVLEAYARSVVASMSQPTAVPDIDKGGFRVREIVQDWQAEGLGDYVSDLLAPDGLQRNKWQEPATDASSMSPASDYSKAA